MSTPPMFGIIVSGRLVSNLLWDFVCSTADHPVDHLMSSQVQTECQTVSETQILFNIADADNINHVVVFMTGQTPFPDGLGGAVYFSWPSAVGQQWQLLGSISNAKPSAIFKITNLKTDTNNSSNPFGQMAPQSHLAQIGISVEPLTALAQQTPIKNATASTMDSFMEFSKKMCENLFNYVASFAVTQAQMTPNPTETFVPLSSLQTWYQNFIRRLEQNPNFWKS